MLLNGFVRLKRITTKFKARFAGLFRIQASLTAAHYPTVRLCAEAAFFGRWTASTGLVVIAPAAEAIPRLCRRKHQTAEPLEVSHRESDSLRTPWALAHP
jgi:hypothetical protein